MIAPLIALTGLAGSGKTTLANELVALGYAKVSFAQPIRDMLRALGLTDEQMSAEKNTPVEWLGGKTPRQIMQSLGTEWGRNHVSENLWVNAARNRIQALWNQGKNVVIDDCRFDNEAVLIREMGGKVVLLNRPGCAQMNHASEAGVSAHLLSGRFNNSGDDLTNVRFAAAALL